MLRQRIVFRIRVGYLLSVASCILFLTLYPVWHGRRYETTADDRSGLFHPSFLLAGGAEYERHPLWEPPLPLDSEIKSTVRWPWYLPNSRHHVEIDIEALLFGVFSSLLVLGILLVAAYRIFAPGVYDWFFLSAIILTSLLLIVLVGLVVLVAMLSLGHAELERDAPNAIN